MTKERIVKVKAEILLDTERRRTVVVEAPLVVTGTEMQRIQKWIGLHFIVEDEPTAPLPKTE